MPVAEQTDTAPAFELLEASRVKPASLLGSLGVHLVGATLLALVGPYLGPDPGAIRTIPLRVEIHIPPAAFLSSPAEAEPARKATDSPKVPAAAPAKPGAPPPKLFLPPLPPSRAKELTILLPNLPQPPTAPVEEIRVPSVMVWTQSRVKPRQFTMPGARQSIPVDLQSPAPLSLELPKDIPAVSGISLPAAATPASAKLPVQISATRPVRAFQMPTNNRPPQTTAPIETIIGDPTSLIVLSPSTKQPVDRLRLPDGSQVAAIHATRPPEVERPDPAGTGGSSTATKQPEAPAPVGVSGSENGDRPGFAKAPAAGPPMPGTGELAGGLRVTGGAGASSQPSSIGGAGGLLPNPVELKGAPPIRVEHPVNGVFDVVVVQTSALNDFPGIASLNGSPVYTVYLPVGRSRTWVLQYCVPKEQAAKRQGAVVQLGNFSPLKPPYPRVTVAPPGAFEKIVVHGFLSDAGQFEQLRVMAGEKAAAETMLLQLLDKWVMRPATRDGKPVRVEMMLLIAGT